MSGVPERVGPVALATLHGLASLADGMLEEADLDEVVGEAVDRILLGLAPRP